MRIIHTRHHPLSVLFCLELIRGRCMDSRLRPIFEPTPPATPSPTLPIALIAPSILVLLGKLTRPSFLPQLQVHAVQQCSAVH
ncbi:hypothetical protein CGRA01v4_08907 [Colletotrichum graminicola]|nr:hypothetical protein CGRA01v4_08907 [Colletotrichum graminicola]